MNFFYTLTVTDTIPGLRTLSSVKPLCSKDLVDRPRDSVYCRVAGSLALQEIVHKGTWKSDWPLIAASRLFHFSRSTERQTHLIDRMRQSNSLLSIYDARCWQRSRVRLSRKSTTNSRRVPHVRTSVRGIRKTGEAPTKLGLFSFRHHQGWGTRSLMVASTIVQLKSSPGAQRYRQQQQNHEGRLARVVSRY